MANPQGIQSTGIHDLSPEVLAHIFVMCAQSGDNTTIKKPSPKAAPLLLTTICHYWRSLALQTPELWTRCYIYIHHALIPSPVPGGGDIVDIALIQRVGKGCAQWLARAGEMRTSIIFDIQPCQDDVPLNHAATRGVVERLCAPELTNQWESLDLRIDSSDASLRSFFYALPSATLQSLTHLTLQTDGWSPPSDIPRGGLFSAPGIRALRFSTSFRQNEHDLVDTTYRLRDLPIAKWDSITELILDEGYHSFTNIDIYSALSRCHNSLQLLRARIGPPFYNGNSPQIPIGKDIMDFPHLHTLDIVECRSVWALASRAPHLGPLLSQMYTPALTRFRFVSQCHPSATPPGLPLIDNIAPSRSGGSTLNNHAQINDSSSSIVAFANAHGEANTKNLESVEIAHEHLWPAELAYFLKTIGGSADSRVTRLALITGPDPLLYDQFATARNAKLTGAWLRSLNSGIITATNTNTESGYSKTNCATDTLLRDPLTPSSSWLFPNLREFVCHLLQNDEFTDEDLLEFIKTRWGVINSTLSQTNVFEHNQRRNQVSSVTRTSSLAATDEYVGLLKRVEVRFTSTCKVESLKEELAEAFEEAGITCSNNNTMQLQISYNANYMKDTCVVC